MSAMSASPVKPPVLPSTGVSVPPPVATSPSKVGLMQISPSLTIAPSKPTNMNHTPMPLSLIADHKMSPQFSPQTQTGTSSAMQPTPQPLLRTPEKPKEITVPTMVPVKPTSNGTEGLIHNIPPLPVVSSGEHETLAPTVTALSQKLESRSTNECSDSKITPTLPETPVEPTVPDRVSSVDLVAKTEEPVTDKSGEASSKVLSLTETSDPAKIEVTNTNASTIPTLSAEPNIVATNTTAPIPPPSPAQAVAPTPPTKQPTPPPEQPVVTPSVSRVEPSLPHTKPEMKVATIPRQATKRKREPKVSSEPPEIKKEDKEDDRKSKRVRLPTQPYQSPLPELNIIAKINKSSKSTPTKAPDDKLIVFYKNEFLAVRNAEGGFYVCQAMQNIYKSSARIRIRWLSQEEDKDTYSPDFYDHTDFDCILTNLNLDKVDKEKFKLPLVEQQRTESILKRALDVERGVSEKPPVTEEHPDGLDLSLFRDESQLKKPNKSREKKTESLKSDAEELNSVESEGKEENVKEDKIAKKVPTKTVKRKKKTVKKKTQPVEKKVAGKSANSGSKNLVQAKKKVETRVGSKRKSSVSSNSQQPPDKRAKKTENSSQPSDRTNKTKSAETGAGAKPLRDRRTKSRK